MKRILAAATSSIATTFFICPNAGAQTGAATQPENRATGITEIVVTARRVEEPLQEVPLAVTALTGGQLEQFGISQPTDLRQIVAGLNVTSSSGRMTTPIYSLRGQRAADTVITQDPPVAVYQDEVLISPPAGANLGLFDLENVQVLKGPQGTLFGRNTTGGAVLYTSARPTNEFEGSFKVGYGSDAAKQATAVVNAPFNEAIRLRGAVDYNKSDGYGKVTAGPSAGQNVYDRDEIAMRLSAAIDPTDWLKTLTIVSYAHHEDGGTPFHFVDTPRGFGVADAFFNFGFNPSPPGFPLPGFPYPVNGLNEAIAAQRSTGDYDTATAMDLGNEMKLTTVSNAITIDLSDQLTFKNIFGYRKVRYDEASDYDGTQLAIIDAYNSTDADIYSEEAQFQGRAFDDRLDFIVGAFYFRQKGLDGTGLDAAHTTITLGLPPQEQLGYVKNQSLSGFGQLGFKITDTLKLNAGVRHTMDWRRIRIVSGPIDADGNLLACNFTDNSGTPLPVTGGQCERSNQRTFAEPSYQLGLDWKVDPGTLLYVTTRHSFRSGGFNLRGNNNDLVDHYFKPESVNDLEVGLKRDWDLGGNLALRTNLAGYYQWYKDIQRNVSTVKNGAIGNETQNAAKANIYGLEAEFELRMGSLAQFALNYAYVKPSYDDYPTTAPVNGIAGQPDNYKDYDFQYIPRHQINSSLTLTPDIGTVGKLSLTANVYYQSRMFLSEDYQSFAQLAHRIDSNLVAFIPADLVTSQKGYALLNLRAELENIGGSNFSVALWGRNVLDKRYLDGGVMFQDSVGAAVGIYGPPRTYGGEIAYKF